MPSRGNAGVVARSGSRRGPTGKASRHSPQASSAHTALTAEQPRPVRSTPPSGSAQNTASSTKAIGPFRRFFHRGRNGVLGKNGVASLELPDAVANDGAVSCCGGGASPKPLERGLDWLGKRFTVLENPGGGQTWHFYYLYGLERVGRFTARRFIGSSDWYREGARMFVSTQDGFSGAFRGGRIEDPVVATSFALLFLAKGRRPVIVAKSRHDPGNEWNRHGHDIAHLVEHVEARWRND